MRRAERAGRVQRDVGRHGGCGRCRHRRGRPGGAGGCRRPGLQIHPRRRRRVPVVPKPSPRRAAIVIERGPLPARMNGIPGAAVRSRAGSARRRQCSSGRTSWSMVGAGAGGRSALRLVRSGRALARVSPSRRHPGVEVPLPPTPAPSPGRPAVADVVHSQRGSTGGRSSPMREVGLSHELPGGIRGPWPPAGSASHRVEPRAVDSDRASRGGS